MNSQSTNEGDLGEAVKGHGQGAGRCREQQASAQCIRGASRRSDQAPDERDHQGGEGERSEDPDLGELVQPVVVDGVEPIQVDSELLVDRRAEHVGGRAAEAAWPDPHDRVVEHYGNALGNEDGAQVLSGGDRVCPTERDLPEVRGRAAASGPRAGQDFARHVQRGEQRHRANRQGDEERLPIEDEGQ